MYKYHMVNCFHDQSIHFFISTRRIIRLVVPLRGKILRDYPRIFSLLGFMLLGYRKIVANHMQHFNLRVAFDLIL